MIAFESLLLDAIGNGAPSVIRESGVVPIEQTDDGWFCLLRSVQVAHVNSTGKDKELVEAGDRATALVGSLARRFPLATRFVPRTESVKLCPTCNGTGTVPGLPEELRARNCMPMWRTRLGADFVRTHPRRKGARACCEGREALALLQIDRGVDFAHCGTVFWLQQR